VCPALYTILHTILYRTDLIIFPLTLQTIIIAPMVMMYFKGRKRHDIMTQGHQA